MTFGSLFAGIGGLDLGLERAGMVCRWQVEIDDYAQKVLAKHWPTVQRFRDVREFPPPCGGCGHKCGPTLWRKQRKCCPDCECDRYAVDVICGGFPCQDISNAGKRAGIDGARSGLWAEFYRVVCEVRPRFVLVENASALLARGFRRVLGDLAASGYDAEWDCLPASAFGAPHRRDRLFIIAYSERSSLREQPRWCRRESGPDKTLLGFSGESGVSPGTHPWAPLTDLGRSVHGLPNRLDRLRCLGNAVVPQVAEYIGRRILEVAA
jgi:DNA (cytosine-5)-methyltransferase 1